MNQPEPSKQSRDTTTAEEDHLGEADIERACGPQNASCVPLVCNDDECYVPTSELDATLPKKTPTPRSKFKDANPG